MNSPFGSVSQGPRMSDFGSNKYLSGTKEFLESNSIVAKFAFLMLVLLVFVLLLRLGASILGWLLQPNSSPMVVDGMIDAKQMMVVPQDPSISGAVPILRSKNDPNGIAFTWSVWVLIDDVTYRQDQYKHIFHKGNDSISRDAGTKGLSQPNNAPGLYISPGTNDLVVVMNTFDRINEEIVIKDIPINKWVNVIIRVNEQHQLDVYINGRLVKRHILTGVPKQNYDDVYVAMNGGFSGYISSLRYFAEAIGTNKIQSIVDAGPNMKMIGDSGMKSFPRYLSLRWFFAGSNDMYNP